MISARLPDDGGKPQEPPESGTTAASGCAVERVSREARQQAADRDASFEPRKIEARARVDAEAECQVPVRRASDIEPVGIGELRRVAVRCADAQRHARSGRQLDVADARRLRRYPVAELVRAVEAQEFLDGSLDRS